MLTGCSADEEVMVADEQIEGVQQEELQESHTEENEIYVYVCGHVKTPGVYTLEPESRICDALDLAGGVTEDGNPEALAQAEYVTDGQTIYVPGLNDETGISEKEDGLIDINTADKEMLMTLPGIGESKADIIIQYREEHGKFESIEDLMNIPGIKEGVFNKIKDGIRVS